LWGSWGVDPIVDQAARFYVCERFMTQAPQVRKSISKEILRDTPLPPTKEPEIPFKESALKAKPKEISLPPGLAREARIHTYSNGMFLSKTVSQLLR
jgi:hypothetical protein